MTPEKAHRSPEAFLCFMERGGWNFLGNSGKEGSRISWVASEWNRWGRLLDKGSAPCNTGSGITLESQREGLRQGSQELRPDPPSLGASTGVWGRV